MTFVPGISRTDYNVPYPPFFFERRFPSIGFVQHGFVLNLSRQKSRIYPPATLFCSVSNLPTIRNSDRPPLNGAAGDFLFWVNLNILVLGLFRRAIGHWTLDDGHWTLDSFA
jgi:hypothetical protein